MQVSSKFKTLNILYPYNYSNLYHQGRTEINRISKQVQLRSSHVGPLILRGPQLAPHVPMHKCIMTMKQRIIIHTVA